MEIKKRTDLDFSKHQLTITQHPGTVAIYELKIPGSSTNAFYFIAACGVTAVTGDYYNWIFCREFHPSADSAGVSDSYWCEKLQIASDQQSDCYSAEQTTERINEMLKDENYAEDEESKEYLTECLSYTESEHEYRAYAYGNAPSSFDTESIPFETTTKKQLLYIFDAFEEICRRMKSEK